MLPFAWRVLPCSYLRARRVCPGSPSGLWSYVYRAVVQSAFLLRTSLLCSSTAAYGELPGWDLGLFKDKRL